MSVMGYFPIEIAAAAGKWPIKPSLRKVNDFTPDYSSGECNILTFRGKRNLRLMISFQSLRI